MRNLRRILTVVLGVLFTLNGFSQTENSILELAKKDAKLLRISQEDANSLSVSSSHTDEATGITYVYFQQRYKDIKVHNKIITASYKAGKLLYSAGKFADSISVRTGGQSQPSLAAANAVSKAASALNLPVPSVQLMANKYAAEKKMSFSPAGIAKRNIETELFWVEDESTKSVRLAWSVNIDVLNSADWWDVFIDANNGQFLSKYNLTVYENSEHSDKKISCIKTASSSFFSQHTEAVATLFLPGGKTMNTLPPNVTSATYRVIPFPKENPFVGAPTQVTNPWDLAGVTNNATTHGWHFDGTNNYTITRGNNVFAYLDISNVNSHDAVNNWPDTSTTPAPSLSFLNTPIFTTSIKIRPNRKFVLDNLFYWNNLMHDVFYQYGFTEAAGNFQRDNLGRGGADNDWVSAEAQDTAGLNNANFTTPADGTNPRMQMYLWQSDTLVYVTTPAGIAKGYFALESSVDFSTANKLEKRGPVTGQLVYYNDAGGTHEACGVTGSPSNSISGKIALIDRGNCNFTEKVLNAQRAGAIGVIMVNNVPGDPLIMGAAIQDNSITIPAVMVSQADGALFASQLASGVTVTLTDGLKDGSLDNGIVCHEYGHGISSRLTGGPTNPGCLSNAERAGEGWSDYFALMMTTDWAIATFNDGAIPRQIGKYADGLGIRNYPYSTDLSLNPLTYGNMGVGFIGSEVHNIGEIWCAALWDMTWNIIKQQNSITANLYNTNGTGGNVIALNLVMTGLKLQPCGPGFLDGRDAILAADSILYNGAYKCAIWKAFAKRGMGVGASQGSAGSTTDQVANSDEPSGITLTQTDPIVVTSGSNFTINITAKSNCQPLTGYVIRDTIPSGFTVVSGNPLGTLNGNVYSFPATNFGSGETKTFTLTLQAPAAGCNIDSVINDNRDGATTGGFTPSTTGAGGGWSPSSVKAHSGTSSWLGLTPSTISTSSLTSASFAATSAQPLSILSFWHFYNTEKTYDGGVVEYSTNGGTTWTDASPLFLKNGYNGSIDGSAATAAETPLAGRKAFTGASNQFIQSLIDMSSFGTTPVSVRFRLATDNGTAGEGWYLDEIVRTNGCGGLFKSGAYNSSNAVVSNAITPVFVKNNPTTITIATQPANVTVCAGQNASFTVAASSPTTLSYKWQVSTNGGTSFADVTPAQTTASLSLPAATLAMSGYQYRVVLTDATSTLTSAVATLTVNATPAISTQPVDRTACVNTNATFSVTATGATGYVWQVSTDGGANFSNVPGATSATLSFSATLAQNNNKYRVLITSNCGNLTSSAATLSVVDAGITVQPVSTTKCAGDNASFTVTTTGAISGYQWQVSTDGGTNFSNVPGATTNSLTLAAVLANMNTNQYRVIVTSSCGPITSTAATLTVNTLPGITTQPSNRSVCVNTTALFTVTATGVTGYQWEVSTNGGTTYSAIGGATSATLSFTATVAQNNNRYRVVLTNGCGSVTSSAVILTVGDAGITSQPVATAKCAGENASFSITTTGTITSYQWKVSTNGGASFADVPGATSSTLTLTGVTAAMNNSQYQVVVTAPCGTLTSSAATLTVNSTAISIAPLAARICLTDAPISLNATPAGGVWSGTGVSGTVFSPATAGIGVHTLTYRFTSAGSCVTTATTIANVEDCVNRNLSLNDGGIVLYPNPNNGHFFLQVKSLTFTNFSVKIYNAAGQFIAQQEFKNVQYDQSVKLRLNGAANGVYQVKVSATTTNGFEEKTFPMIVRH